MKAYKCAHSGLLYPEAYVKEWGRNGHGVGLGPVPVSECLDTDYLAALAVPQHQADQAMHPVGFTRAMLVPVEVTEAEFAAGAAILHRDDPMMVKRSAIMRERQIKKSHHLRRHLTTLASKEESHD